MEIRLLDNRLEFSVEDGYIKINSMDVKVDYDAFMELEDTFNYMVNNSYSFITEFEEYEQEQLAKDAMSSAVNRIAVSKEFISCYNKEEDANQIITLDNLIFKAIEDVFSAMAIYHSAQTYLQILEKQKSKELDKLDFVMRTIPAAKPKYKGGMF